MIKDGKYKLRKDGQEYDAVVSTLMEGQYPCKDERQFVCIPGHFPIPLDSWLLEDFVIIPDEAAQQARAADVCNVCGSKILSHPIGTQAICSNKHCPTRR